MARTRWWTEDKLQIIRDRYPEEGPKPLAQFFGKSEISIQRMASELRVAYIHRQRDAGRARALLNDSSDIHVLDEWSVDGAYVVGYLWADGGVRESKDHGGYGVNLKCHIKDQDILWKLKSFFKSKHAVRAGISSLGSPYIESYISSQYLMTVLVDKYGVRHNKAKMDLPFPEVPAELLCHFVRGYFDGDGCFSEGLFNFLGTSRFILTLKQLLMDLLGLKDNKIHVQDNTYNVRWGESSDVKKIAEWIYPEGVSLYGNRKRELIKKHLEAEGIPHARIPYAHWKNG